MTTLSPSLPELAERILSTPLRTRRRLIALAGAPASGKSTLADQLADQLRDQGQTAQVVPMDGFHLHNRTLADRGWLNRKGAAHTFDSMGFLSLVRRLPDEEEVFYPDFDRARDIAIAAAGRIGPDCETVIIEGNYLLFDAPIWRDLAPLWDLSLRLDIPMDVLETRLIQRWLDHGLSKDKAIARANQNDLVNARAIQDAPLPADITIRATP
ncbi:nucleoside triphosphate hydrolase domain-containing protein [Pelagimonas phthalicica]|uniref:Nucleoside triphosphate hydrolase domain-containing protein n=1 Tax=Pelagimonas phthalicica TaxID=1037362 RepID=A0A238JAR3_9RHOB|nr:MULTISPECIES: nucleoside/nucleotide kinase family protein [Roseobacteraceae]MBO9465288.1 nucleoside/nucleotide kinase family protein [Tropicibacter sp. R15_0]TDS93970.1 fructokinase [Pelagimonas phthalicica]SMX27505.1 nucleoside triphosphate hydrolase domain-containing protein [Pelagimonas phthalicica]